MVDKEEIEKEVEKLYEDSFKKLKDKISDIYADNLDKKEINKVEEKHEEIEEKQEDKEENKDLDKEEKIEYLFEKKGEKLICTDNNCSFAGAELEVGNDAKSLLNKLNNIYNKDSHDFLCCKKCRQQFDDIIKKQGYSIRDDGNKIILIKKK